MIEANNILCGDCIQVMPQIPTGIVDFILTDPPYLVNYHSRDGRSIKNDTNDAWLRPAYAEMYRVLKRDSFCVTFYGWNQADKFIAAWKAAGFRLVGHITFPKQYASNTGMMKYQHENAYLLAKGYPREPAHPIGDVIDFPYTGNKLHPTQKPIEILTPLIETFSQPGDLVLDPMCGSGSTLVAARLLDRDYLGIELDPTYSALAKRRLEAFEKQHHRYDEAPTRYASRFRQTNYSDEPGRRSGTGYAPRSAYGR